MTTPPAAHRFRFTVQYDGAGFFGWQLQPDRRTVQGELERVLSRLFDAPTRVIGSGRTDRGVHARGQVAAVDGPAKWEATTLERAMNALLPPDVRVIETALAPSRFHPRYGAVARTYQYRVGTAAESQSPFEAPWCWALGKEPDLRLLRTAARELLGDNSFLAFAKAGQEERGDRCIVEHADWSQWSDLGLEFHITANRFLHHMVRYLVGTQIAIGLGERDPADLRGLLASAPELRTSPPAPPQGLFLLSVSYS
ncbi:MAG TPA: tRNA pseudouridine(38-40) synthase TruA [Longimicrobiaceae bacterium]|nr:tRNA pseudouridine(38-40) synthase TruA [Longimicrobiaceae bacterium]